MPGGLVFWVLFLWGTGGALGLHIWGGQGSRRRLLNSTDDEGDGPVKVEEVTRRSSSATCKLPQLELDGKCVCPVVYEDSPSCSVVKKLGPDVDGWCPLVYTSDRFKSFAQRKRRVNAKGLPATASKAESRWGASTLSKFSSCAVVGSSGSLKKKKYGKDIDAHSAVFRCNDAPTKGNRDHVGSKTTVRIQNYAFCGNHESSSERCVFYSYMQPKGSRRCPNKAKCKMASISSYAAFWSLEYWSAAAKPPKAGSDPGRPKTSAGFFALTMALHLCGSVSVYGYEFGGGFSHYYAKSNPKKGNLKNRQKKFVTGKKGTGHKWKWEKACLRSLHSGSIPRVKVFL